MLTTRQKLTVEHLKDNKHITSPEEIIKWAVETKNHPRGKSAKRLGVTKRRHSRKYFQELIEHYLPLANNLIKSDDQDSIPGKGDID